MKQIKNILKRISIILILILFTINTVSAYEAFITYEPYNAGYLFIEKNKESYGQFFQNSPDKLKNIYDITLNVGDEFSIVPMVYAGFKFQKICDVSTSNIPDCLTVLPPFNIRQEDSNKIEKFIIYFEKTDTILTSDTTNSNQIDTIPPIITVPKDMEVIEISPLPMSIDIGKAMAMDNSGISPVITNDAPAKYPFGGTVVTWTATDNAGNSVSKTQLITVIANIAPTVIPTIVPTPISTPIILVFNNTTNITNETVKIISASKSSGNSESSGGSSDVTNFISGGSSAGGGVSMYDPNVDSFVRENSRITYNVKSNIDFKKSIITNVKYNGVRNFGDVIVTVSELKDNPTNETIENVYKWLNLNIANIRISEVQYYYKDNTIDISLNKKDVKNNNITVYGHSNEKWIPLEVSLIKEDDTNNIYYVITQDLLNFAIVIEDKQNNINAQNIQSKDEVINKLKNENASMSYIVYIILGISSIIIILVGYFAIKK